MLAQRLKDTYFSFIYIFTKITFPFLKLYYRNKANLEIHLGCGQIHLDGFINIDGNINSKKDLLLDMRAGLPFQNESVKFLYSSNTFEHFYLDELGFILRECYRVLSVAGILRIVVPDLEMGVHHYIKKDFDFFSGFPENFSSIGGKFANFIFCSGQHKVAFDFSFLKELLLKVGFREENIKKISYGQSVYLNAPTLNKLNFIEASIAKGDLFVEAIK